MKQVITVTSLGEIAGLQVKPGKGFDLRTLGKASITRASEIVWNEENQRWRVELREGAGSYAGRTVTAWLAVDALGSAWDRAIPSHFEVWDGDKEHYLEFVNYDDAVKAEIAVLDGLRLQGKLT